MVTVRQPYARRTWVALVSVVFTVPYTTLQLSGIQVLLRIAGYNTFRSATVAVGVAFALIILFVFLVRTARRSLGQCGQGCTGPAGGGVRRGLAAGAFFRLAQGRHRPGADRASGLDDAGAPIFRREARRGSFRRSILTSLGFYMWPQIDGGDCTPRTSAEPIRRNAMIPALLPVRSCCWCISPAGRRCLLIPGLQGTRPRTNPSCCVVQLYYPPWVLGGVAAAGCLAGLVPASVQLLAAASILSKNVLADQCGIAREARAQVWATRGLVLLVAGTAFLFWLVAKTSLVGLLLIAYNGITQLFPGVSLSLPAATPGGVERRPGHPDGHSGAGVGVLVSGAGGAWPQRRVGGAGGQRCHGRARRGRRRVLVADRRAGARSGLATR